MPAPFYNAIKGTTAGTPGTGAFTPNAAASTFEPWSGVPVGWMGMVRYDDAGSTWERQYSYWNGTTLSRASTQFIASSTGSPLSLTSAATAAMVVDASEVMSHVGGTPWGYFKAQLGATSASVLGIPAVSPLGTAAAATVATTNYLTQQQRVQYTSATTANAQAGWSTGTASMLVSTSAGSGGFEMVTRFGASQLPTGPRLFVGATSSNFAASTGEPSALVGHLAAFTLDSTGDTNIQFTTNSNAGGGTKIDTGIPFVLNGWYETAVWCEPGSNKMWGLLIRIDTGAIFLTSTTTDVPATGSLLALQVVLGLNSTNTGTAAIFHVGSATVRMGQ